MATATEYARRLASLEKTMAAQGVDAVLLNRSNSIRYLTGAGNVCSWVLLMRDGRRLGIALESDRLDYESQSILSDIRVHRPHDPDVIMRALPAELDLRSGSVAAEKDHLRAKYYERVAEWLGPALNRKADADLIVEVARSIKTPEEIATLRKAGELACYGMQVAAQAVKPGLTEMQLNRIVLDAMLEAGGGDASSLFIGTDGRSSLAHNPPTRKPIEHGPVAVDIHAQFAGYYCDMARTFFLDDPGGRQQAAYHYFAAVIKETIGTVSAGGSLTVWRQYYYDHFQAQPDWIPLLGPFAHSVGIANAEYPKFDYPFEGPGYPDLIQANMALACSNIGLYTQEGWGVRYEDTFIVTAGPPDILTPYE